MDKQKDGSVRTDGVYSHPYLNILDIISAGDERAKRIAEKLGLVRSLGLSDGIAEEGIAREASVGKAVLEATLNWKNAQTRRCSEKSLVDLITFCYLRPWEYLELKQVEWEKGCYMGLSLNDLTLKVLDSLEELDDMLNKLNGEYGVSYGVPIMRLEKHDHWNAYRCIFGIVDKLANSISCSCKVDYSDKELQRILALSSKCLDSISAESVAPLALSLATHMARLMQSGSHFRLTDVTLSDGFLSYKGLPVGYHPLRYIVNNLCAVSEHALAARQENLDLYHWMQDLQS